MSTSEEYYTNLHKKLSAPGKRSLERIKSACDTLQRLGANINVAAVGKECMAQFQGPSHGSIRNNKEYVGYIGMRSAEATLAKPTSVLIEPTFDPTQQAYVSLLKSKLTVAERKYKILREFLETRVEPLDIDKFLATQDPAKFGHLMPKEEPKNVTPTTLPSVPVVPKELSDPAILEKFGLEIVKGWVVHKVTGERFYKL